MKVPINAFALAALVTFGLGAQQPPATPAIHGKAAHRLVIKNAMVIYGNAKPPYGPVDIVVQDGLISYIGPADAAPGASITIPTTPRSSDTVIDASGKYVMPGIVNAHMHWHEERQPGIPQPIQYERNLYLAAGVTTARDVGGDFDKSKRWQAESNAHTIISPRILVYPFVSMGRTGSPAEIRAWIRDIKQQGADGLKIVGADRDQLEAIMDEAHKLGMKTAAHIAVEETTAKDYAELGVTSIEHFYGVADAALNGIQNFPPDMSYANEVHRFGRAGELYSQADPEKLHKIIDLMVEKHVAWDPTFSIYEASRDLVRAQAQPWFRDYLHPSMEEYFKGSLDNHGSYFIGWTSSQEAKWKQQYRIWMAAVREFANKGGLVTTGDDAGYIYSMYGFGLSRELELHEEAGFHPLEVIEHATWNGARLLGMEDRIGKVREGFIADLLVVNGNPLDNLKLLNPYGADVMMINGRQASNYSPLGPDDKVQAARGGGIEWTIKDGIPYHVPTLMREVKDMVSRARAQRVHSTAGQP
ncbi:MAG TPA: amidohydrolase family protein [Vicinamibacterales bacterium]|nr:amidohydrolase family protein [Vicinamibacterales bacterium]